MREKGKEETKICSCCHQRLSKSLFYKDKRQPSGCYSDCKKCFYSKYTCERNKIRDKTRKRNRNRSPAWKMKHAQYLRDYSKRYKLDPKNAQKLKARSDLSRALRLGTLVRAVSCEICGSGRNIDGHHPDYEQTLKIMWLCKKCHYLEDKKVKNPHHD